MFWPTGQNQFQMTYKKVNFKRVNNTDRELESFRNKTPCGLICCKPPDCQRKTEFKVRTWTSHTSILIQHMETLLITMCNLLTCIFRFKSVENNIANTVQRGIIVCNDSRSCLESVIVLHVVVTMRSNTALFMKKLTYHQYHLWY